MYGKSPLNATSLTSSQDSSYNGTSTQLPERKENADDGKYNLSIIKKTVADLAGLHNNSSSQVSTVVNTKSNSTGNNGCNPITRIVYIKTHKTGSTTLASIFERFGYHRNLLFALPKINHIFSNEQLFSRKFMKQWPAAFTKKHRYYDMLVNHAVYNRPELVKVVPNATYVTILRDPVKQLESAFGYFEMYKGLGLPKEKAFETFMNNPTYYYKTKKYNMKSRSRNGQLYDLGFNHSLVNDTNAIHAKIDTIDKEFDLVMITDYFDESLILLRKLLCWSFEDILYVSNGIRSKSHRFSISDDLRSKILKWNAGDVLLYNHFNRSFWQKVDDYGPDFTTDLEKFKRMQVELFNRCVNQDQFNKQDRRVTKYILNSNHSGAYCSDMVRSDVPYTQLIRKKMKSLSGTTNNVPRTSHKVHAQTHNKTVPKTSHKVPHIHKTVPKASPRRPQTHKTVPKGSQKAPQTHNVPKTSPKALQTHKIAPKASPGASQIHKTVPKT